MMLTTKLLKKEMLVEEQAEKNLPLSKHRPKDQVAETVGPANGNWKYVEEEGGRDDVEGEATGLFHGGGDVEELYEVDCDSVEEQQDGASRGGEVTEETGDELDEEYYEVGVT